MATLAKRAVFAQPMHAIKIQHISVVMPVLQWRVCSYIQVWPDKPGCYQKRNKHICRQLSEGHILHMISTELICTSTSVSQSHSNTLLAAAVVKQTRIPTLIIKLEHCGVKVETVG